MRYIGAIVYLIPVLLMLFIGGPILQYGMMVLALIGIGEFYSAVKAKGFKPTSEIGYLLTVILFVSLSNQNIGDLALFLIVVGLIIVFIIPIFNLKKNFVDGIVTIAGFLYVSVLLSFLVLIGQSANGSLMIWFAFVPAWIIDTGAYFTGRSLGRNKLCPEVSPNKTIEGAVGGLLGGVIATLLLGYVFVGYGLAIPSIHLIILGVILGILGQLGDLIASSIKRYTGIKDYGNLIPGHGGVLDRFDSILLTGTVIYYYITIFMGM